MQGSRLHSALARFMQHEDCIATLLPLNERTPISAARQERHEAGVRPLPVRPGPPERLLRYVTCLSITSCRAATSSNERISVNALRPPLQYSQDVITTIIRLYEPFYLLIEAKTRPYVPSRGNDRVQLGAGSLSRGRRDVGREGRREPGAEPRAAPPQQGPYATLTVMARGWAFAALGNVSVRTPCFRSARIPSWSICSPSSNCRKKLTSVYSR